MHQLSIPRITRLTYGLGAVGTLITFATAGPRSAIGFLAGVALSLISVRSWTRLAEAVGGAASDSQAQRRPTASAAALFLVFRYILVAGAIYVSIKYLGSAPAAVLVGLLVSFSAVVLDFLLGTARSS